MKNWEEMTPNERKISLIEDVLDRIDLDRLNVQKGSYIRIQSLNQDLIPEDMNTAITPDQCKSMENSCEVCARGALLLSRIRRFNSVKWSDFQLNESNICFVNQERTAVGLDGAFTQRELDLIEIAFEGTCEYASHTYTHAELTASYELYVGHTDDTDRLVAIMKRILANGGEVTMQESVTA